MAKKTYKKPGDPFEDGDPVWVMNLGGKNRPGFYEKKGFAGFVYVRVTEKQKAGWWIDPDQNQILHRYPGDGVEGDPTASIASDATDDLDPLSR